MTDRENDPSPEPETPSRDNTIATGGGEEPREPAASASAPASDAGDPQAGSSRPRMRVVIHPLPPELRDTDAGTADGVPPNDVPSAEATSTPKRPHAQEWNADPRLGKAFNPAKAYDIDPVDALVELAIPTRSLTDWLLPDPLNRWRLFGEAIAKDRAGVDAALARAREHGYTASRFTDALKALVHVERGLRPPIAQDDLSAGALERGGEQKAAYGLRVAERISSAQSDHAGEILTNSAFMLPKAHSPVQQSFQVATVRRPLGWQKDLPEVGGGSFGAGGGPTTSGPNPWGRLGGPAHRAAVKKRATALEEQGYVITGGGGRHPERSVRTPEGQRRFPDISASDPQGREYYENVGRSNSTGMPVARERPPMEDIRRATGVPCCFTPYDR